MKARNCSILETRTSAPGPSPVLYQFGKKLFGHLGTLRAPPGVALGATWWTDTAKERVVDKRQIREMRHQAGIRHFPWISRRMTVGGALIIGARYLAIGLGDTALYIMAAMAAAVA